MKLAQALTKKYLKHLANVPEARAVNTSARYDECFGLLKQHLKWMCLQIEAEAENWHPTKAHRWIGFIQGVLWCLNNFTIDDLREHVNSENK